MAKRTAKRKPTSTKKKKKPFSWKLSRQNQIILGSLFMLLGIALFFSFVSSLSSWEIDQSTITELGRREVQADNALNKFGAALSDFLMHKGFGLAAFVIPILITLTGLYYFFGLTLKKLVSKWFWGLFLMMWGSIALGFFSEPGNALGGRVGTEINDFLQDYTGSLGVVLTLIFVLVIALVRLFNFAPDKSLNWVSARLNSLLRFFQSIELPKIDLSRNRQEVEESFESTADLKSEEVELNHLEEEVVAETRPSPAPAPTPTPTPTPSPSTSVTLDTEIPAVAQAPAPTDEVDFKVEAVKEEKEESVIKAEKLVKDYGEYDPRLELGKYQFPPIKLLDSHGLDGAEGGITINKAELEENKNKIVATLKNYKIGIAQIKATIGPTVTLYEIVPEAGVRISKIKNLEDDIALSLSALGIRIIAPIPGKGTIGIEVPNTKPSVVSMRSVIASTKFQKSKMELPIAFGKTISNETFVVDLAKMPHMLMAGATGQGKSVGLNAVISSLLYKKHPAEVKFVLVDPKKVELTLYNKIERHFLAKLPDSEEAIITDTTKVIHTLNSLCIEMDNRYELLKGAMVRNIKEYNQKFKARRLNPEEGHRYLPYIVLVIDEFADLIMTAGKEVETPIARLAQLARAIGIHLIIATQRPSVNVITGIIKANFPARLAFRVTSKIDSRTILEGPGADQLIGRGDMLYTQGNDVTRLQCAFVDTPEVEQITEFIGSQRAYPEAHLLPEYVDENSGTSIDNIVSERDSKFRDAAEVVVTAQQGSASLIQRKLKLGYNRAGRIIDQLEAAGIVGPFEGSKARQVLVPDMYSLEQLLENETT